MKKRVSRLIITSVIVLSMLSQKVMAGFKLPDIGKMASEAASGIADAAGQAGEAISGVTDQAGKAISDVASQAGKIASDTGQNIGKTASGTAQQLGYLASGFASQAGAIASEWGHFAGETADGIKDSLTEAGIKVQVTASELGNATAGKAAELTDMAGKTATEAINAVAGAGNMVIDQAGHVVDMAAVGAAYVSDSAGAALGIMQDRGAELMQIAQDAVKDIDLSDEKTWDTARAAVDASINSFFEKGIAEEEGIDQKTIEIITDIVFGTLMNTYQYTNGDVTLEEYTGSMSEVIVRDGLPIGVGVVADMLCKKWELPFDGDIARDVTYYLISVAYEDDTGEEIEVEEESFFREDVEEMTE